MTEIRFPLLEVLVLTSPEADAFQGDTFTLQDLPYYPLLPLDPLLRSDPAYYKETSSESDPEGKIL